MSLPNTQVPAIQPASMIPEGWREDAKGRLVRIESISDVEIQEDELVRQIAERWRDYNLHLQELKAATLSDIQAHIDLANEKYGVKVGGAKGNLTLYSFDGKLKVTRKMADDITFDVRLQGAKALIDECLHEWTDGSPAEVRSIIDHAFAVDKEGKISTGRILGLRRIKSQHPKWLEAMQAIADSVRVISTKAYLQVFEKESDRPESGWRGIVLDVSRV